MGDRQAGFTLAEVLIAAALSSLVALIAVGVLRTMQIGAGAHGCMVESAESVRLSIARLADDVRVAQTVNPNGSSLSVSVGPASYTYTLTPDGKLKLAVDGQSGTPTVLAQNLDTNQSNFRWDPSPPTELSTVQVKLVLAPASGGNCKRPFAGDTTVETSIFPMACKPGVDCSK